MTTAITDDLNGRIFAALMRIEASIRCMIENVLSSEDPRNPEWWIKAVGMATRDRWSERRNDAIKRGDATHPSLWHYASFGELPAIIDRREQVFRQSLRTSHPKQLRKLIVILDDLAPLRNAFAHPPKPTMKQAIEAARLMLALVDLVPAQYHDRSDLRDSITTLLRSLPQVVILPRSGEVDANEIEDKLAALAAIEHERQRLTETEETPHEVILPVEATSQTPRWVIEDLLYKEAEWSAFARLNQILATIPEDRRLLGYYRRKAFDKARREGIRELMVRRIQALEECLQDLFESVDEKRDWLHRIMFENLIDVTEYTELCDIISDAPRFTEAVRCLINTEKQILERNDQLWRYEDGPDDDETTKEEKVREN